MKKYMEMHVMLFKNQKCVFEGVYQTPLVLEKDAFLN